MNSTAASRKYIDLLYAAATKWANWDPDVPAVQVGDYGLVNKETGEFEVAGSIYRDEEVKKVIDISEWLPQEVSDTMQRETHMSVESRNSRKVDLDLKPGMNAFDFADVYVGGRWEFERGRGAILVMYEPRQSYIPRNVFTQPLNNLLDGYSLVTQVYTCPGYVSYLSHGSGDSISVGLGVKLPIPSAPGINVQGVAGIKWCTSKGSGVYREGLDKSGKVSFTPLYSLKKIKTRMIWGRIRIPMQPGLDILDDEETPWSALDEDGEERDVDT